MADPPGRPRQRGRVPGLGLICICAWVGMLPALGQTTGPVPSAIKPPLPVWPSDSETITERSPTFRINGRQGARGYRVELASTPMFADPLTLTDSRVSDDAGIEPIVLVSYQGKPLEVGTWYWRACCRDAEDRWTAPANYRTFHISKSPDHIEVPRDLGHPRLILGADDLPAFRERLARSEYLRRGWQYIENAAMSMLGTRPPPEEYARAGGGQHGNYSAAADWYHRHLDNLAFVAYVGKDHRLAQKGVEMLLMACGYTRWLGPYFDDTAHFDPPWHAALETAMMTEAVAIAYDLLYDVLTEDQRRIVRDALMEKGVRPLVSEWVDPVGASRIPRHQLPNGNWVMVCSSGAGVGALALLGEHPEAPEAVRLVRNRIKAWLADRGGDFCADGPNQTSGPRPIVGPSEPNFGPQGGFKESITYMNYAMRYVCYFADPYKRITGDTLFDLFPPRLLEPVSWSVLGWLEGGRVRSSLIDFGDCGPFADFYDLYTALMRNRRDGRAAWLCNRTVSVPQTPRPLVWYDDTVREEPPQAMVPMAAFPDIGQVVLRSGWSPDSTVAAIKFHQNRGHLDLGTFCLFGAGGPTIIDSGVTGYGSQVYREYSSQTVGHNVVLVDGKPQQRTDGTLLAALGTSTLVAAAGQLATACPDALGSWTRDLVMLPGGDVLVYDRLDGKGAHQFDYVLHPGLPFELSPGGSIRLENRTILTVQSDRPLAPTLLDGYRHNDPRQYVRYVSRLPSDQQSFAMLCRWPAVRPGGAGDAIASGSLLSAVPPADADRPFARRGPGRWLLDRKEGSSELLLRLGGSDDRVATDARLAVVWHPSPRQGDWHLLMLAGTRLAVDGHELVRTPGKVDLAIEKDRLVRLQVRCDEAMPLRLSGDSFPTHAFMDREPLEVRQSSDTVEIALSAGQHEVELSEARQPIGRLAPLILRDLPAVRAPASAPAFERGIRGTASTSGEEPLAAVDGDLNTAWTSMPGVPMPQWMEISLLRPMKMNVFRLNAGQSCQGRLEVYDVGRRSWCRPIAFKAASDRSEVLLHCPVTVSSNRIRVVVEQVDNGARAMLKTLEWSHETRLPPAATATQSAERESPRIP